MTFKKSYVPGILGSVLTLTVIMAAPVKAETKEETILKIKVDKKKYKKMNIYGIVSSVLLAVLFSVAIFEEAVDGSMEMLN